MIKRLTVFCVLLTTLSIAPLQAQDQHFSQFYAAPLTFNPALTGAFNGRYRLGIIYRDQWRRVLDYPNVSYAGSVDMRFGLSSRRKRVLDAFGAGVVFYSDKFSGLGFSTNQISLSGAFHKSLSNKADQFLSLGFQVGIAQRNVNYENITFEDQFSGDGFGDPTAEMLPENNFSYGDLSVGLNYTRAPEGQTAIFAGAAIHHIMEPQVSFYFDPDEDDPDLNGDNRLLRKYTAHLTLQIPLSESIQLLPRGLFYLQGPHMAFTGGANFRFVVNDVSGIALHVGAALRPVRDIDSSFQLESAIGMVGVEFQNFLFGFSYDANLDDLTATGNRRTAFEISIAYLGDYDTETVLCPKF